MATSTTSSSTATGGSTANPNTQLSNLLQDTNPPIHRKRGETEMSVLKYKLNNLGSKTTVRAAQLQDTRTDHTVLYDHSVSNSVARGFTRVYLQRATGKLTTLLNKPRMKSVDAAQGECEERDPDEYHLHAVTKMKRLAREREILMARPSRVGWREKLGHAQVQRGLEERKAVEGRKSRTHDEQEASRAAMKRRGRDSDEGEMVEDEEEKEERLAKALAEQNAMHERLKAAAAPVFQPPSASDFFLTPVISPAKANLLNEQNARIKDLLDSHTPSHLGPSSHFQTPTKHATHGQKRNSGRLSRKVAIDTTTTTPSGSPQPPLESLVEESKEESTAAATVTVSSSSATDQSHMPSTRASSQRSLRGSASTPSLSGTSRAKYVEKLAREETEKLKAKYFGLHPTDMGSATVAALKMIPTLPCHQGLAAEDVKFTFEHLPQLFVDTHTALEIACAHVHFYHFKSRHKQMHYLLLSPDSNYLCLVVFWWLFCKYFQSPQSEPKTPQILDELLKNIGKKYQEYVRYLKIHLALKSSQRLNSWYDQFGNMGQDASIPTSSLPNFSDPQSERSRSGSDPTKSPSEPSQHSPSFPLSPFQNPFSTASSPQQASTNPNAASFDPFTCVPIYPFELFNDAMQRELMPKTRSGVHHQQERFLFLLPYVYASACYELFYAFFPESSHFLTKSFRQRLERDLHLIFNGMELSEITLIKQRTKFMRESEVKQTTASMMPSALLFEPDDPSLPSAEKPSFESLFAFNTQVNASATRPGEKFHAAILNPNHSSVPGSPWLAASAKKLAQPGSTAHPTPLTRHTRIGGVLEQLANGEDIEDEQSSASSSESNSSEGSPSAEKDATNGDVTETPVKKDLSDSFTGVASDTSSQLPPSSSTPTKKPRKKNSVTGAFTPTVSFLSPASIVGLGGSGVSSHLRAVATHPIITSERAFHFGAGAAAAGQAVLAERVAAFSSPAQKKTPLAGALLSPPSTTATGVSGSSLFSPSTASSSNPGDSSAELTLQQQQQAHEEKLRRRARERPLKGSLHSTGDWSRDERERRQFLTRMQARHQQLERENEKERARMALREKHIEEAGGERAGLVFSQDDAYDPAYASFPIDEAEEEERQDPISSAFESVMHKRLDDVPTSILQKTPSKAHLKPLSKSMQKSMSTPTLGRHTSPPRLNERAVGQLFSPASSTLQKQRPSALSIPNTNLGPGLLSPQTASTGKTTSSKPLDRFVPQAVSLDPEAASGFTASDLCLPLQSILLTEENLRHAQQLRPPQIRLNLNALTVASSVSLAMRQATSAWGNGLVLKHTNPIPSEALGEDLNDGFAFKPKDTPLSMNTIHYSTDAEAQASQLRLLQAYKNLHALQLQEHKLRGAHSNANLEFGEIQRAVARSSPSPQPSPSAAAASELPNSTMSTPVPNKNHSRNPSSVAQSSEAGSVSGDAEPSGSPTTTSTKKGERALTFAPSPKHATSPPPARHTPQRTPAKQPRIGSLHKTTKLEALLAESKQFTSSVTSQPDDPTIFLTPRTKLILAQVESNADVVLKERARKERESQQE